MPLRKLNNKNNYFLQLLGFLKEIFFLKMKDFNHKVPADFRVGQETYVGMCSLSVFHPAQTSTLSHKKKNSSHKERSRRETYKMHKSLPKMVFPFHHNL